MSPAPMGVCVFQLPTSGHVNPLIPVLAELIERGVDVCSTSTPSLDRALTGAGVRLAAYPPIVEARAATPPDGLADVCALLAEMTEVLMPWCVELLRREQPAVVISDSMAPWGHLAAAHLGIPCVASSTTFVLHGGLDDSLAGKLSLLREIATGIPDLLRYARYRSRVRRQWTLDPGAPVDLLAGLGDFTIAHTSRQLQPGAELFDDTVRYIGTAVRPASPEHPELATLPDGPLLYASLGTLYNERPDFFRSVLHALADHPGPVLLSIGRRLNPETLGALPANAIVRASVPQLAVLARADAFITHGGMNSTTEGLVHGVPMVFAPQTADQPLVARRIAALGAGIVLRGRCPSPEHIRRAVDDVRQSDARTRAAELGAQLLACGGARAAADVVLEAAGRLEVAADSDRPQIHAASDGIDPLDHHLSAVAEPDHRT
jgi:MGT family glycosyltransferase